MKPPFGGVWFFNDRIRVICFSNLVCSIAIHEINVSSNTCHVYFLRDTHGEKYNAILDSDP